MFCFFGSSYGVYQCNNLIFFSPNRRTHGGRKLWESKDERKWGHDKFEEITLHERHNEEVMVV